MIQEFNLTFIEALDKLMKGEGFIRSNIMADGVYLKLNSQGILYAYSIEMGHENFPFQISKNSYNAKWKCFPVANKKSLT